MNRLDFKAESAPFITPCNQDYPHLLAQLSDAPEKLFYRGRPLAKLCEHRVAIVGSRNASSYGCTLARQLGRALTRNGIAVCSGLAKGIDAAAHQGALQEMEIHPDNKAFPVAVLGHGWNYAYPLSNLNLRRQLEELGVLLTEYEPKQPPTKWTFPGRNRIIAGLCQGVVVVEAGLKSGSLHTARFACEAGREVWVVPQRPGTANSIGVLRLLKDGATPIIDVDDFVRELVSELRITYPKFNGDGLRSQEEPLDPLMARLLQTLRLEQAVPPEAMAADMNCSLSEVLNMLVELEILGRVVHRFDGCWTLR